MMLAGQGHSDLVRSVGPANRLSMYIIGSGSMDTNLTVAIVATSASMATGMIGMWINASQTGKRIDDFRTEFHTFRSEIKAEVKEVRMEVKELRTELTAFKDVVNGKLQAIDFEIAKLMDRPK